MVALSLGLASFSLAGLYCNHADLSPRYAPILLSLTNTTGAVPGIIGVACTGTAASPAAPSVPRCHERSRLRPKLSNSFPCYLCDLTVFHVNMV